MIPLAEKSPVLFKHNINQIAARHEQLGYDPAAATDALHFIPTPEDRIRWIDLGMAAKRAGVSFDDFNYWCSLGTNYSGERACRRDWDSITADGAITAGTLYRAAMDAGWRPRTKTLSPPLARAPILLSKPTANSTGTTTNNKVQEVWEACTPADLSHPYLVRKRCGADGLRCYPASAPKLMIQGMDVTGWLVVPCWSGEQLQTLQFIPQEGKKLNMPGGKFADGYHLVGDITPGATIFVVEGIGQAWACAQATNSPAVCTFGAGRMKTVAEALQRQHPHAKLVLVPDRGQENTAAEIAASLNCYWAGMPQEKPNNYDANDFAEEYGNGTLQARLQVASTPALRYKVLSAAELADAHPLSWMVRGLLPHTGLAALYGASGSGKSFLTLDLAAAIAGGADEWYGKRITHCPVTYCVLEGEAGMGKRVKAWQIHHDKPLPEQLRFVTQPVNVLDSSDVDELARAVLHAGGAGGLVILDTLNRAAPEADENTSKDMGAIISAAKQLQHQIGGLVLLVHHTGKDSTKGMRGHSSLFAALDGAIGVITSEAHGPSWTVAKSKDDATGAINGFRLEQVVVGVDDEGEDITSCVAIPIAPPMALRKSKRLTKHQQTAHDIIQRMFAASEGSSTETSILVDDVVRAVEGEIDADAKHKRVRAKEAIEALIRKDLIESDDIYFRPTERMTAA